MILKNRSGVFLGLGLLLICQPAARTAGAPDAPNGPSCDAALAERFAPRRPVLGRYEVCADPRPLAELASADWVVESLEPLDAFGLGGNFDRSALARLYGGLRVRVAHRWDVNGKRFESETYISPFPNAALSHLERGTLIVRWTCEADGEAGRRACTPPTPR
jgi:hypothetical protein